MLGFKSPKAFLYFTFLCHYLPVSAREAGCQSVNKHMARVRCWFQNQYLQWDWLRLDPAGALWHIRIISHHVTIMWVVLGITWTKLVEQPDAETTWLSSTGGRQHLDIPPDQWAPYTLIKHSKQRNIVVSLAAGFCCLQSFLRDYNKAEGPNEYLSPELCIMAQLHHQDETLNLIVLFITT